jgi:putative oxidoreductase
MTLTRLITRPMLASMFVVGGVGALKDPAGKAKAAQPVTDKVVPLAQRLAPGLPIPTDPVTLVRINGAVQVVAGLALATGRAPRLAALVLAASLVPTTAAGHRYWEQQDPETRAGQKVQFFKNVSMLGGLLIAAGDTDGKPGVAWRARRATQDLRRETARLAHDARREARLAAAKVG